MKHLLGEVGALMSLIISSTKSYLKRPYKAVKLFDQAKYQMISFSEFNMEINLPNYVSYITIRFRVKSVLGQSSSVITKIG